MGKALAGPHGVLKRSSSLLAGDTTVCTDYSKNGEATFSLIGLALSICGVRGMKKGLIRASRLSAISVRPLVARRYFERAGQDMELPGHHPEGSVLDQPNAVYGALFYVMVMILDSIDQCRVRTLCFGGGRGRSCLPAKILVYDLQTVLGFFGSYVCVDYSLRLGEDTFERE